MITFVLLCAHQLARFLRSTNRYRCVLLLFEQKQILENAINFQLHLSIRFVDGRFDYVPHFENFVVVRRVRVDHNAVSVTVDNGVI